MFVPAHRMQLARSGEGVERHGREWRESRRRGLSRSVHVCPFDPVVFWTCFVEGFVLHCGFLFGFPCLLMPSDGGSRVRCRLFSASIPNTIEKDFNMEFPLDVLILLMFLFSDFTLRGEMIGTTADHVIYHYGFADIEIPYPSPDLKTVTYDEYYERDDIFDRNNQVYKGEV
uniref:Bromo domain-containing protein n=1 Tax=Panagrellus redivivus TaxID=6233 RepID=A0A7E4ZSK3_PANRE